MSEWILVADVRPRRALRVEAMPWLAGRLAADMPGRKPRGMARYRLKLAKAAYGLVHHRLGVAAPGAVEITGRDGHPLRLVEDFADTALIALAEYDRAGGYDPLGTAFVDLLLPRLERVVDVGANLGYYAILMATHPAFRGHVDAFEASPATAARLVKRIAAAGLSDRVTVHPFGLSATESVLHLEVGRHSALASVSAEGKGQPVPLKPLDAVDVGAPGLIKIDVEGHEHDVLIGAERTLARHKPALLFESWHIADTARALAPLRYLEERGYALFEPLWRESDAGGAVFVRTPKAMGATMTLGLRALPAALRPTIGQALDLVAWHRDRIHELHALFRMETFAR